MKRTYREIWRSNPYSVEIYDNCDARLEVRSDGQRARLIYDTTYWINNTGGFKTITKYIDGRASVRSAMRILRLSQIESLKMGEDKNKASTVFDNLTYHYGVFA